MFLLVRPKASCAGGTSNRAGSPTSTGCAGLCPRTSANRFAPAVADGALGTDTAGSTRSSGAGEGARELARDTGRDVVAWGQGLARVANWARAERGVCAITEAAGGAGSEM